MASRQPPVATFDEVRPRGADKIGHLQRRPIHLLFRPLLGRRRRQRQRVERAGGLAQMLLGQMKVDCGLFQIAVPEQNLDGPQVGAGRCVAKQCLKVCGWTGLVMPARSAASRQALQTTFVLTGWLAVCQRLPGNSQTLGGRCRPRQYARSSSNSLGLSMTSRSLRPLPP